MKQDFKEVVIYMKNLGYSDDAIYKILTSYPIYKLSSENILQYIKDIFREFTNEYFGYTKSEVIKMTKRTPEIFCYSLGVLKEKAIFLKKLGYSCEKIKKMTVSDSKIYTLSVDSINNKFLDLEELGYSKQQTFKITKKSPSIWGYDINTLKQKIEDIENLGYKKEEVIYMTVIYPKILELNIDTLKNKINTLIDLKYSLEEIRKITICYPALFGLKIDNIKQKIVFYQDIDISEFILYDSKQLMQSVDLSYARYMFYKEKDIEINNSNYRKLFTCQRLFFNSYGVTNEYIKEKYKYKDYLKQKVKVL